MRLPESTSRCLSVCASLSWSPGSVPDGPGSPRGLGHAPAARSLQPSAAAASRDRDAKREIPARFPGGGCARPSPALASAQRVTDGSGVAPGAPAGLCLPGAPGAFPWEAPCGFPKCLWGPDGAVGARVTPDCGVCGAQVAFTPSSLCGCNWGQGLCVLRRESSWGRLEGSRPPAPARPHQPLAAVQGVQSQTSSSLPPGWVLGSGRHQPWCLGELFGASLSSPLLSEPCAEAAGPAGQPELVGVRSPLRGRFLPSASREGKQSSSVVSSISPSVRRSTDRSRSRPARLCSVPPWQLLVGTRVAVPRAPRQRWGQETWSPLASPKRTQLARSTSAP